MTRIIYVHSYIYTSATCWRQRVLILLAATKRLEELKYWREDAGKFQSTNRLHTSSLCSYFMNENQHWPLTPMMKWTHLNSLNKVVLFPPPVTWLWHLVWFTNTVLLGVCAKGSEMLSHGSLDHLGPYWTEAQHFLNSTTSKIIQVFTEPASTTNPRHRKSETKVFLAANRNLSTTNYGGVLADMNQLFVTVLSCTVM